jgi:hypothetical protein
MLIFSNFNLDQEVGAGDDLAGVADRLEDSVGRVKVSLNMGLDIVANGDDSIVGLVLL